MIGMNDVGACCAWPKVSYNPATLPAAQHASVRRFFLRSAQHDILPNARSTKERRGLEERCEEAASEAYLYWLGGRFPKVAEGDHAHAIFTTRRYFRLSAWQGRTGLRRQTYRKRTREMIAERERFARRRPDTPTTMAMAVERLITSPMLHRKALMLAKRTGHTTVDALLSSVAGEGHSQRGRFVPQATAATAPASHGERSMVPAMAANADDYRAALKEYYAAK